ncbi:MAG TPA: thioesterase domain-containing protein [Vicinamibacterales bacterium]
MARSRKARRVTASSAPDLTHGTIVVLSGGGFDAMNPPEVRARMDQYIADVNADSYVKAGTAGKGLAFKLLPNQRTKHLHQTKWRALCQVLRTTAPAPLILVGHSNGGAAAVDLARCLEQQGTTVDLLFSADSVLTLDDNGDVNAVPSNVSLNVNSYVIPTSAWLLAPFPIGRRNRRKTGPPLAGIMNAGLEYNLPGAVAHRNAFYDVAGGDRQASGVYKYPHLLLEVTLAVLRGDDAGSIASAVEASLRILAKKARISIDLEQASGRKVLPKL